MSSFNLCAKCVAGGLVICMCVYAFRYGQLDEAHREATQDIPETFSALTQVVGASGTASVIEVQTNPAADRQFFDFDVAHGAWSVDEKIEGPQSG